MIDERVELKVCDEVEGDGGESPSMLASSRCVRIEGTNWKGLYGAGAWVGAMFPIVCGDDDDGSTLRFFMLWPKGGD